jgi:hypothetical protein
VSGRRNREKERRKAPDLSKPFFTKPASRRSGKTPPQAGLRTDAPLGWIWYHSCGH